MTTHTGEDSTSTPGVDQAGARSRRRQWGLLLVLLVILAAVVSVGRLLTRDRPDARVAHFAAAGGPPALEGETLDGTAAALEEYRGEPVLVVFWAHWCPHCRVEMPVLQDLHEQGRMEMLTVTTAIEPGSGPPGYTSPEAFVETVGLDAPVIVDATGEIASRWQVDAFPALYFVGSEGEVREVLTGEVPADRVTAEVDALD